MKSIFSIDPSARNQIGYAALQIDVDREIRIVHQDTFKVNKESSLYHICQNAYKHMTAMILSGFFVDHLVIEYPQFMQGTKGAIAAQQGYTLDLAFVCGFFAAKFGLSRMQTHMYTPIQWKGTKPKSATLAHYKRVFDTPYSSEHSVDAVMLGHYFCKVAKLID